MTLVPAPVVIVVGPLPAIPPQPNLSAAATATVTVAPEPDLGDSVASTGKTHRGHHGDRNSRHPDLTAVPTGPDAAVDSEIRPEENDGDGGNVSNQDGDDAHPRCPGHGPDQAEEHG